MFVYFITEETEVHILDRRNLNIVSEKQGH